MNFGKISEELNTESTKQVIDSILNAGCEACVVIDRSTFEVLYENDKAIEVIGDRVGMICHEVFCTKDTPCMDCPMLHIHKTQTPLVRERYEELLDSVATWRYSNIAWFDGRDAVLATLVALGDNEQVVMQNMMEQAVKLMNHTTDEVDKLTGLPNRIQFYDQTQAVIQDLYKNFAIVLLDIERFKNINDIYGIAKGDEVLRYIARVLQDMYGDQNNYARLHSDMFVFYINYEKKGEIIKEIEKIRKKISNNPFGFDLVTKFGIYLVDDRSIPVNLMCDRAMMAERTVKGNIMKFCAFYDEHYREEMLRAGEIEQDMERALVEHQYQMYLQPKYRLSDNSLCGAEVLCRWKHPRKGLIPPNDFIPLFEKNGFILKLDEYMWEEACKNIRRWLDEGHEVVPISVNISRYHIQHNNLEDAMRHLLTKYNLTPDHLNLEITESLFLDNPEELNRVLVRLQNMGFKLEVDDFGSGFSSLNLIRNISVDTIKIDKEFLDSEIASEKGKIVVNHTIGMAKDLNLQVVAEGVETKAHVDFLKESHCDIAQGYFFAKPMPVEEFERIAF